MQHMLQQQSQQHLLVTSATASSLPVPPSTALMPSISAMSPIPPYSNAASAAHGCPAPAHSYPPRPALGLLAVDLRAHGQSRCPESARWQRQRARAGGVIAPPPPPQSDDDDGDDDRSSRTGGESSGGAFSGAAVAHAAASAAVQTRQRRRASADRPPCEC